jgi:hypothetical protein
VNDARFCRRRGVGRGVRNSLSFYHASLHLPNQELLLYEEGLDVLGKVLIR